MLTKSATNTFIKYFAYGVMGLTVIIFLFIGFSYPDDYGDLHPLRWLFAFIFLIAGTFNAALLFAISEALSRLQEIEYNTERTYKSIEREWKEKASS